MHAVDVPERIVGLDLAVCAEHKAVILQGGQVQGKPFSISMTPKGIEKLIQRGTEGATGRVLFAMEPTGPSWLTLTAILQARGHEVLLVKPQKVHDLRKFLHRHTKSDVLDAEAAARTAIVAPEEVCLAPETSAELVTLRRLVMQREREIQQVAGRKKRVKSLLRMVLPCVVEAFGQQWDTSAPMAFLKQHVDPFSVVERGRSFLRKFWRKHGRGQGLEEQADRVYAACETTTRLFVGAREAGRLPFDYVEIQSEILHELETIERCQAHADYLEKKAAKLVHRLDPERTLEQLRGVGELTSAAIYGVVGAIERFRNASAFVAFCGLCPRKKQTGVTDPRQPMTKAGHKLLKKYLYLAADTARQWDPDFAEYYARRYAKGDHHNSILIALARKMALRVYALLRKRAAAEPVGYELRNSAGTPLTSAQARELILMQFAREVVAPDRAAADRKRSRKANSSAKKRTSAVAQHGEKGTGAATPQSDEHAKRSSSDAVNVAVAAPSMNTVAQTDPVDKLRSGNQVTGRARVDLAHPIPISEVLSRLAADWGVPVETLENLVGKNLEQEA